MRIALSSYRSKPHSGGQGIYVRNLSRELVNLGHEVEVFSGQPYPELDEGVGLTRLPSLDLYRPEDPFRRPARQEFRDGIDVLEFLTMCTSGFPEPRTFSMRLARHLSDKLSDFDVLHDNQTLGPGLLQLARRGMPVLTTIHHPISQDRRLELADAHGWSKITKRRWYGFVAMQRRVAQRCEHLLTVSEQSARDIVTDFGVRPERLDVVPVGVDVDTFTPMPYADRVPGRLVAIVSADVPLKGLSVLIAALSRLDRARWSELVVVGTPSDKTQKALADAGLLDRVRFEQGLPTDELAALMASAQVHVVPSLYEGFSLPTVEAMSCGTALVASRVGALPELLASTSAISQGDGPGLLVAPGDPDALADALADLLADPERCARMGEVGRERAVSTYSWASVARATAAVYQRVIDQHRKKDSA
ncbi:glycosyltransferase family 4 protein [Luteipulveratus mongoliensis]|uniref:Glycosyl transferase family 1 n=1 Tax=Luteipulveratus mongoliensis TaxID=571913 RepID=A0A0K1JEQ5_9MICO|nr:glycosyltransferase family 4 protein [Luteipulveratus mongoliensis]AKU15184.1 glycosyl transferase family 1 [Luteipulveratus mongoliensis]